MSQEPLSSKLNGVIEVDETYVGGKKRQRQSYAVKPGQRAQDIRYPFADKAPVAVLQSEGRVQSMHIQKVTAENLRAVIEPMVADDPHVMTDSCISTNTIEGYFSILNRGLTVYTIRWESGICIAIWPNLIFATTPEKRRTEIARSRL